MVVLTEIILYYAWYNFRWNSFLVYSSSVCKVVLQLCFFLQYLLSDSIRIKAISASSYVLYIFFFFYTDFSFCFKSIVLVFWGFGGRRLCYLKYCWSSVGKISSEYIRKGVFFINNYNAWYEIFFVIY